MWWYLPGWFTAVMEWSSPENNKRQPLSEHNAASKVYLVPCMESANLIDDDTSSISLPDSRETAPISSDDPCETKITKTIYQKINDTKW